MNAVGIDVSKGKSTVTIRRPGDEVVMAPRDIHHTQSSISELISIIKGLDGETKVCMEHTGRYYEPVATWLSDAGIFVSAVNPILIRDFGDDSIRAPKTDKADAKKIARFTLDRWFKLRQYSRMDEIRNQLKTMNRQFGFYMDQKTAMRAEIIKLRSRINTTFMYVTHDQTEAMTLADRIVIMKDGFVNQIGTPQELFNKPVNLFVAGFIGMPVMNFFEGCRLLLDGDKYYAEIRGVRFELDAFQQKALKSNGQKPCDIVCGIRPQHITVGEGDLTATVEVNELMGSEYNIHARSGDDEVVMVIPTVGLATDVSMGSRINFTAHSDLIQLFDKESGNNLIWYDAGSAANNAPVCKDYPF